MQNNQISNSQAHPLCAIYKEVSDATRQVSDFIGANPNINPKGLQEVNRQLVSMIQSVDEFGEANNNFDYARQTLAYELRKASDQCTPVSNLGDGVRTYNSFQDIFTSADRASSRWYDLIAALPH